jgi:hypothetical protein
MKVTHTHGLALGPLLAATLREHKAAIVAAHKNELDPLQFVELTATLTLAAAQRVTPALTLADVEKIVDTDNAGVFFAACWGVTVPEPKPGEALQAVENPSS